MDEVEVPGAPGLRTRKLRDPDVLRALAHPVRLQLLEELAVGGPATATALAKRVGESQANCSWHLRQLHRFGFIEEVEGAKGRQRPWRYVMQGLRFDNEDEPPESAVGLATEALRGVMIDREVAILKHLMATHRPESPWRSANESNQSTMYLTVDELKAFTSELSEVVTRHFAARHDRIDPAKRPPGSRLVRYVGWAVAGGPETEIPEKPPPDSPSPPPTPEAT
jgi:DNA-binding transcriptional ArsR family regulator